MLERGRSHGNVDRIREHLKEENPLLADVVDSFARLDRLSRKLGFLGAEESYAARIPWWPVISVLGVYSAGKSAFINHYIGYRLQATGSQAVDDKFTVICFSGEGSVRVLPGLALDADPRFPLFKISRAIEDASPGEGRRIDAYLQLKTCRGEKLRGKILIDSPGFDADAQRTSILKITDHIIDLSDLVLVFFDARHPELGSMSDTLDQLVKGTIHRHDSGKFLYVLNQIDATANEDNPEQVFAAWQRALAQYGLTAGKFYMVYNPEFKIHVDDESLRARFEKKSEAQLKEIHDRMEQVKVERSYRIVGLLERTAAALETEAIPDIRQLIDAWRRRVLWLDSVAVGAALLVLVGLSVLIGYLRGPGEVAALWRGWWSGGQLPWILFGVVALFLVFHFYARRWSAERVNQKQLRGILGPDEQEGYSRPFRKNTRWWRSIFARRPSGAGKRTFQELGRIRDEARSYIQKLNDLYTAPSG
jgi:hypothetical protein